MKGHTITRRRIAAGLLRQEKNHCRFWAAYYAAHRGGTVTNEMTARADQLLAKQQTGMKLFNK